MRTLALAGGLLAGTLSVAAPALADNHPERTWLVKESAHFSLHYYPGIEKTADRLLRSAEAAYPRLASDFGVTEVSQKIPIIITQDSFFNGEAEPLKDRITLDPGLAATSVIGTQRFVTHELAHIMTFASVNTGNKMAMLSNVGGMPSWFLEGIAQYEAEYWYPSNDRMLRLSTLENDLLTTSERDNFHQFGVYSGAAGYNEGYSLCRYMFDTYGREKVKLLMADLKKGSHTFDQAIASTFGQNLAAIESAWRIKLAKDYKAQTAGMDAQVPGAAKVVPTVLNDVNVQPRTSPDGKHLAYLSSRYEDSFLYLRGNVMGFLSLFVADPDGRNPQMIPLGRGVVNNYAWSSDSNKVVYSRVVGDKNGNPTFDMFVYDIQKKTNTRLTTGEFANSMAWRPGHDQVLYVSVVDGKDTIKVVDTRTKKIKTVYTAQGDNQYVDPAWSPDGERVALTTYLPNDASHLVVLDPMEGKLAEVTPFVPRKSDFQPAWTPDGKGLVFSSDRTGMTNLYQVAVNGTGLRKLTNTFRGAEMPTVSPDGKSVYFTSYRSKGAEIFRTPLGQGMPVEAAKDTKPMKPTGLSLNREMLSNAGITATPTAATGTNLVVPATPAMLPDAPGNADAGSLGKIIDKNLMGDAQPYKPIMTNDMLVPQMTSDERGQQVGLAGIYSDILGKNSLGFDVRYGIMSSRFSYLFQYTNNMWNTSWQVSLYDQPQIGLSPDVGTTGRAVTDSLYFQRQRGVNLAALTPLGGGRSLMSGFNISTLGTLSAPLVGDYGQLKQGQLNTMRLSYHEAHGSRTVDSDINPSDGYALNADWQMSDHNIGSSFNYSQYVFEGERYFAINPDLRHNLTWRWDLGMINGDAPQPFMLGGANVSNPIFALRGYAVGAASGNRLASTGLEYTLPIFQHIDRNFGPIYLDRLYLSAFTDVGSAWNNGDAANPFASTGLELRLKTNILGQQGLMLRFGIAQKIGSSELPGFYLTF